MKKVMTTLAVILLVCVASVFALTACNVKFETMDGSEYFSADNKERSVELIDEFFEETLKDPDLVITCKDKEGAVRYTETVKGTSSCTVYSDGSKTYAFKKGDHFYVAEISPSENGAETHTYACSDSTKRGYYAGTQGSTMEDKYNAGYCRFMSKTEGASLVKELAEEGATFHCMTHIEWVSNYPTGDLDFSYTADTKTVKLTANSDGDKVTDARLVITDLADSANDVDLTWSFVHGGAAVSLPDTDAWDRADA